MSLDISVTNKRTGASRDMNWLRNPFGLCTWAENNYSYVMERDVEEDKRLWHVINNWSYDKSPEVDKPLFLEVVRKYGNVILNLDQGYFWFTESGFKQFIQPNLDVLPTALERARVGFDIGGTPYMKLISWEFAQCNFEGTVRYHFYQREHLGIPMQYLGHPSFHLSDRYRPNAHTLAHYQDWYRELIEFAEMLQDPDAEFYCSN